MTAVEILVKQVIDEAVEDTNLHGWSLLKAGFFASKVALEHRRGSRATTIEYLAIIALDFRNFGVVVVVVSEAARRKIGHSFVVMDFASAKQFTAIVFCQERSLGLQISLLNFILIAAILDDY